jgi:Ca-activated chloride channel family protein
MITDALANTGVTDERLISMIGQHYDARRIRLSGIGVGREFNDALLDRLTERGKGAYVFLGSPAEVEAVFGGRFTSLIETTANDVHFQLHLPPSLRMNVFYGEESSTVKEDVQAVHYFAGTSQLFLSDLMAKGGTLRPQDDVMLTIEYEHPETGQALLEEVAFNLGEIGRRTDNVRKGRLVTSFIDGIHDLARRVPDRFGYSAGTWVDPDAYAQCEAGRRSLDEQARGLEGDPEVRRVLSLWERYCARYEQAGTAVRRTQPTGRDVWPGAH